MINFILDSFHITSILALSLGITAIGYSSSETPVSQSMPVAQVTPLTAEMEVQFVPTHSLYQKRCIVDDELVYCADTGSLATVSIIEDEIEIEFVAQ